MDKVQDNKGLYVVRRKYGHVYYYFVKEMRGRFSLDLSDATAMPKVAAQRVLANQQGVYPGFTHDVVRYEKALLDEVRS